jgi:hypothetical protein
MWIELIWLSTGASGVVVLNMVMKILVALRTASLKSRATVSF